MNRILWIIMKFFGTFSLSSRETSYQAKMMVRFQPHLLYVEIVLTSSFQFPLAAMCPLTSNKLGGSHGLLGSDFESIWGTTIYAARGEGKSQGLFCCLILLAEQVQT